MTVERPRRRSATQPLSRPPKLGRNKRATPTGDGTERPPNFGAYLVEGDRRDRMAPNTTAMTTGKVLAVDRWRQEWHVRRGLLRRLWQHGDLSADKDFLPPQE
ncbi:MAG TPA: hypothetical protein VGJ20_15800 [Xanthobacteraceae bacterium]|jgi:hypothetical protein